MWSEGRESPSVVRSVGLQRLVRLRLVHRPGYGTSGMRPVETCSIHFCSDDHNGREVPLAAKSPGRPRQIAPWRHVTSP